MKDLTVIPDCKAVGPQLLPIIQKIDKYNLNELKMELIKIMANPETTISPEKTYRYTNDMKHIYTLQRMQLFLTNIYCKSAGMGITKKVRK